MDRTLDFAPDDRPLFSRGAILLVFASAVVLTVGCAIWSATDRSELLYEIDPDLKAFAIGAGVFVGILADAVYFSAMVQGIGVQRTPPGVWMFAGLIALPVLCALGGTSVARSIVAYRAFHDLPIVTAPMNFTITGVHSGKSGPSLTLLAAPGERSISLRIDRATYRAALVGAHVTLPVQTGRGGVQRMIPPADGIGPGDLFN